MASSDGCVRIAPTARDESSMCTWNFFDQSGNFRIGAFTNFLLRSSNEC